MIRAFLAEDLIGMRLNVSIVQVLQDGRRMIYRPHYEGGSPYWEEIQDSSIVIEPSFSIDLESAHVLLGALMNHFHGADDARALRADYNAERQRVDKLMDVISKIALKESEL